MATREEADKVIARVVRILYDNDVQQWSVQDKGVLIAAVKLQLSERERGESNARR